MSQSEQKVVQYLNEAHATETGLVRVLQSQIAMTPRGSYRTGLEKHLEFSGFVSEEEKIRLFKASRCFLMPSRHEGSPRVIGESLIAETPVVAYEIPNYRPLFGDFVRYAPPFDLHAFQQAAQTAAVTVKTVCSPRPPPLSGLRCAPPSHASAAN